MCKIFVALNFRGPDHPRNYFNGLPVPCVKNGYVRASLLRSLKKFRALNFCGLGQQRNFFNNENFPIYGIWILYIYIYIIYMDIIYIYICTGFSLKRVSHAGQAQRHAEICTCCVGCFAAALCWPRVGCWWQRCIGRASAVRAALYRPHVSSAVSAACRLFVTALYRPR